VYDHTVIIWTTDNGTSRGIQGMRNGRLVEGGKGMTVEPGICLPFIVHWPDKITKGWISNALIDFTDLYPTFMAAAGATPPTQVKVGNEMQEIDGQSFLKVLLDEQADSRRDWILSMGGGNRARLTKAGVENEYRFRDRVVRDKRFKLYVNPQRQPEKFIDLQQDPGEEINLIDSLNTSARKESYKLLTSIIDSFPGQDNDPRYKPNPPQEWDVAITAESDVWKK
jgi:arylsulfatase A-like enzyme